MLVVSIILLSAIAFFLAKKTNISNLLTGMIVAVFLGVNIFFLVKPLDWDYEFRLTPVKEEIDASGKEKIFYVGSFFRYNPQFSFYFDGLDIGWHNDKYSYYFADTKDGFDNVKNILDTLTKGEYNIIVEKDNINRTEYPDSKKFIPENFKLVKRTGGYELYQN